jgi:hypothetical protein
MLIDRCLLSGHVANFLAANVTSQLSQRIVFLFLGRYPDNLIDLKRYWSVWKHLDALIWKATLVLIDFRQVLSALLGSNLLQTFEFNLVISFSKLDEGVFDRICHYKAQVDYEIKTNAVDKRPSHRIARSLILNKVSEAHKVVVCYGDKDFVKLFKKAHSLRDVAV